MIGTWTLPPKGDVNQYDPATNRKIQGRDDLEIFSGTKSHIGAFQITMDLSGKWMDRLAKQSHTIHVWYIHLHSVDFYGKCR